MNKIQVDIDKSDYENYPDFLNIRIDDRWLDEIVDDLYPDKSVKGTIPTLSFGMERDSEEKVVWDRFIPTTNSTTYCPILMCPDDCDFYCICIVAEIKNNGSTIVWSRLGSDASDVRDANNVGTEVNWFPSFLGFEFNHQDYAKVLDHFKRQFDLDKADYEIRSKNSPKNKN